MILYPNKWILLPDGKRYQGEIDKATGLPHGLGMMALDATTFYAGEFSNGKRHGRGFLITLEVEENERLCKASAEAKLAWTMPSRRQTSVENELVRAMPSVAENFLVNSSTNI